MYRRTICDSLLDAFFNNSGRLFYAPAAAFCTAFQHGFKKPAQNFISFSFSRPPLRNPSPCGKPGF